MLATKRAATLAAILFPLVSATTLLAQASRWVVPPSIIDFTTSTPIVTPLPGLPSSDSESANGVFDATGNLLFFVLDGGVFDADGGAIGSFGSTIFNNETPVISVPGNCHQYYILYSRARRLAGTDLFYSIVDLEQKQLVKRDVHLADNPDNRTGLAVTRLRDDGTRFLYAVAGRQVQKFMIGPAGITLLSTILDNSPQRFSAEVDLSPNGTRLAWSGIYSDRISVITLDSEGNFIALKEYPFASVGGLEFSPDSSKLFFGNDTQLGYIDLINDDSGYLNGSTGYGRSLLELAADGKIYMAGKGDLGAIDPTLDPITLSFTPAAVPGVSKYPPAEPGALGCVSRSKRLKEVANATSQGLRHRSGGRSSP